MLVVKVSVAEALVVMVEVSVVLSLTHE